MLMSERLERALRWAARSHHGQMRKGSETPYVEHVVGVAMILQRLGYEEDIVIAGLFHDLVEDTAASLDDVSEHFGENVASLVAFCSEQKLDAQGRKRPWEIRKRDHINELANAPEPARAIVLADKLHNLVSMACDLRDGRPVWSLFNSGRDRVLWYYETTLAILASGDEPRLQVLADECRRVLAEVRAFGDTNQFPANIPPRG